MFSQSSVDSMDIDELVRTIKSMANEVNNRIENPYDAWDYCNSLINLSENLRDRIDNYMADDE